MLSGKLTDMLENYVSTSYLFSFRNLLHFGEIRQIKMDVEELTSFQ